MKSGDFAAATCDAGPEWPWQQVATLRDRCGRNGVRYAGASATGTDASYLAL